MNRDRKYIRELVGVLVALVILGALPGCLGLMPGGPQPTAARSTASGSPPPRRSASRHVPPPDPAPIPIGGYKVLFRSPMEYAGAHWVNYKIRLSGDVSKARLEAIARRELDPSLDCAYFYFYRPGTDLNNGYTAGRVEWGPGGDPANAKLHPEQRGQDMRFTTDIELVSRVGPVASTEAIPEARRRKIFYRMVQIEDAQEKAGQMADNDLSSASASREFHISKAAALAIESEGAAQHWPMPPDPSVATAAAISLSRSQSPPAD